MEKKKKKGGILSKIILVIALGVFVYSGFQLYSIYAEYSEGEEEYESIQKMAVTVDVDQEPGTAEEPEAEVVNFSVDFEKLLSINEDCVAWIRFDNPDVISYPVVMSSDNADYLHTTFEGKYNAAGTLFVDYQNEADFSDVNTFIYGHNMKNGSMFGKLRQYKSKSFWEESPYFYIYMPDGREVTYEIFSVCVVKDVSQTYDKYYTSSLEFEEYIKYVKGCDLYDTGVEVTADSQIVSLSTCTNVSDDERLVVHGVKIAEEMAGE